MRGLSLLEVVIALALVALGVVFVLGIIPTSVLSVKRSENIEAATAYGMELVEDARQNLGTGTERHYEVEFNNTRITFIRALYTVDESTTDIVVVGKWSDERPGIHLATRVRGVPVPSPTP
jgi:Tfp pilus assembly protein PilV